MKKDLTPVEWLTGLVLGAASAVPANTVTSQGTLTNPTGQSYSVCQILGETAQFTLYQCILPDNKLGVLKIAATEACNTLLDTEAQALRLFGTYASTLEATRPTHIKPYNYQHFFPHLEDSFVSESQKCRRVNILGFPKEIDTFTQLTPLSHLVTKEHVYVDPRTSAWILGKLLKVLAFAHQQGVTNNHVTLSNVLIEKEQHGLILFDWSAATHNTNNFREEIGLAANITLSILGGDSIPDRYSDFINELKNGTYADASRAHAEFYQLIWSLWPRKFHPYTCYPL